LSSGEINSFGAQSALETIHMLYSEVYRSQTYNWGAGAVIPIQLGFLDPARRFAAPTIDHFLIHFNGLVNTGTNGGPVRELPQLFTKIQISDPAGDRINLRGSSVRVMNQLEYGEGYNDGVNIAASQSAAAVDFWLRIPFAPLKARRRADYRIPLFELVDGGQFILNFGSASTLGLAQDFTAITSGTVEVYAEVFEERVRELKSRMCFIDYDVQSTDYSYAVNGSLRSAVYYAGEVAENNASVLAAQNFTSRTLNIPAYPLTLFKDKYKLESKPRIPDAKSAQAGTSVTEDVFVGGYAVALFAPRSEQKIGAMPDMASLHFKTDGTVTTTNLPKLILSFVTDRSSQLSMRTLGVPNEQQLATALASAGHVRTWQGKRSSLSNWKSNVASRLPAKLRQPPKG
jgi:hypothetical protein